MMRRSSILGGVVLLVMLGVPVAAFAQNVIQTENAKAGATDWRLTNPALSHEIEGYASLTSVNRGGQISLYVNTNSTNYTLDIYRLGWYGGLGARRMGATMTLARTVQPACPMNATTFMTECSWTNPAVLTVPGDSDPTNWASGIYLAKLTGLSNGKQSYITFTVRDDARPSSTFLFTQNVTTYNAYNYWGGKSLYTFNSTNAVAATKVSFNRPYANEADPGADVGIGSGELLHGWEYNALRWLEKEGYDVTYATSVDLHTTPSLLQSHRGYLSFGHNEYWSMAMRTNVIAAADAGVHMGFFGANVLYWQIRFETSPVTGAANRTQVCYKTTSDPVKDTTQTIMWRQLNMPEAAFIGTMYRYDPVDGDIVVQNTSNWIFANTGLHDGDHLTGLLGYEVDSTDISTPASAIVLGSSPYSGGSGSTQPSNMTVYTRPSGAIVMASGSMQISWGLDDYNAPQYRTVRSSAAVQQMFRNILNRYKAVNVLISPTFANLGPGQTGQFTTTVTGTTDTAVTWSVSPAVGTVSPAGLYTAPSSIAALQTVTVTATSVADSTSSASATVTLNPTGTLQPIRLNAGGPVYTDTLGQVWGADAFFTGGTPGSTTNTIANTNDQTLFKTERWGATTYTFSVPNGSFDVLLKFAETYFTAANKRSFGVTINGTAVLTNVDLYTQAGGANRALDKTFNVNVTNGTITVQLVPGTLDDPTVNAIQITSAGTPIAVSVAPTTASLFGGQAQQFTPTVTGTANTAVTWTMSPSVGTLSAAGLYTAPATVTTQQTVLVTATSAADPTKKGTATVTLMPPPGAIAVTVSPATASLGGGQSRQFTATVTNTANTAVTWSMSPSVGTLSAAGLYTAPATVSSQQTVTVTATSVADVTKSGNATVTLNPPAAFTPIRVNAGGPAYTDTLANVWAADTGFSGGSTDTVTSTITNTTDQTLYKSERWGAMSYTFAVPNGSYDVTLKFAEIYFTAANQRLFNVTINGTAVLSAFDVYTQAAGANKAVDKTFTVNVTTGSIAIAFTVGTLDDPKVSAIQIVQSGPPPVGVSVSPATASLSGSQIQQFTATVTNTTNTAVTWSMSPSVGTLTSAGLYTAPSSVTTQQTVTITATSVADPTKKGTATVTLNPPPGTVTVTVSPATVTLSAGKTQQFTATVTGNANTAVTWSLSPSTGTLSTAGLYTAPASIASQQTVTITATSVADTTKKATATVTLTPFAPIRVNAGGPAYTDTLGNVWAADTGFTGGSTASTTTAITNTTDQTLYKTERWGATNYSFTVPNGSYTVTLKMAEIYFATANQRLFSVVINGTTVVSNLDIFTQAGGANRALDLSYPVTVSGGTITIQFVTGSADDPKVSAIQIVGG